MTKKYFGLFGAMAGALLFAGVAFAQENTPTFPIAELGGCSSKAECKTYCDQTDHRDACIAFAEEQGLMFKEEAAAARSFIKKVQNGEGPGSCSTKDECQSYCAQAEHRKECVAFALENGLRPPPAAERHRQNEDKNQSKIVEILSEGPGPGGCTTPGECKTYCGAPEHREECFQFAKDHGLMSADEADRARILVSKPGPGDCRGEECKVYCAKEEHRDECTAFAIKHGFMTKEKADHEEKLRTLVGPGNCQGVGACREYCANPEHRDECRAFAQENNLGTPGGNVNKPLLPPRPNSIKPALPLRTNVGSTTRPMPFPSTLHPNRPNDTDLRPQPPQNVRPGLKPFFQTKEREGLQPTTTTNLGASVISALQLFLTF